MSLECLQDDYERLFENEKDYDVIIYSGKDENVKESRVHSNILSARSQYFCTELSKENIEKKDGKIILKKPDISPKLFKIILRFIYCGRIDLATLEGSELLKLSIEVNNFNVHSLIPLIEEYLIKHQSEFLDQNPVEILETVCQHESFTNLLNLCLEKICEEPKMLFNSDKFINLKAPSLELLLRRDDLNLDEAFIWDSLLKWGFAQNPSISQDITKWNKEEITIMERTLHRFIPLIRFYYMTPEDFLDKICPLKELLPKDLINNLLTFYVSPNRRTDIDIHPPRNPKKQIDSVIIKPEHLSIFASWIDKKENLHYNVKNIPYNFNLLYRANRDSNTAAEFHNRCDNKGATIVIAKITNSEHILGGYNPLYWNNGSGYMTTNDSFIFSFTNRNNLQTAKVGYVNGNQNQYHSIYCYKSYGPTFGGGHDLSFQYGGTNSVSNHTNAFYHKIDIPVGNKYNDSVYNTLYVEDYEVFQVIKK